MSETLNTTDNDVSTHASKLLIQFQRDINRLYDVNDRNSRKRGLTKLVEELPWGHLDKRKHKETVMDIGFLNRTLLTPVLTIITDPTEKCRDLSLKLLKLIITELHFLCKTSLSDELVSQVLYVLCKRIGGDSTNHQFNEPAEELRLAIVSLISYILELVTLQRNECVDIHRSSKKQYLTDDISKLLLNHTLPRILTDSFPAVKRECGDLVVMLLKKNKLKNSSSNSSSSYDQSAVECLPLVCAENARYYYKDLILKGLLLNITHQHNKVRSITLKALAVVLRSVVSSVEDYEAILVDTLLPLLSKHIVCDGNANVKKALCQLCDVVMSAYYKQHGHNHASLMLVTKHPLEGDFNPIGNKLLHANATMITYLLILMGDPSPEVVDSATKHIGNVAQSWYRVRKYDCLATAGPNSDSGGIRMQIDGVEEENAELIMQQAGQTDAGPSTDDDTIDIHPLELINSYLCGHCDVTSASSLLFYKTIYQLLVDGVNGWTSSIRIQFIRGLKVFYRCTILQCEADYSSDYDYEYIRTLISTVTSDKTYDSRENEKDGTVTTPTLTEEAIVGLGVALRSDEIEIRLVAQDCTVELGVCCGGNSVQCFQHHMDLLITRISGVLAGGDTASQRCNAIRVVTYMLNGYAIHCEHQMKKQNTLSAASLLEMPQLRNIIYHVLLEITQSALYVFKEAYLYESILLLLNEGLYRSPLLELISTDKTLIECILLCYIYLLGFQSSSNPSAMSDRDIHLSCGVGTTTTTGASSSVIHAATMKSLLQFCRLVYDNSNTNVTPANANAMPVALSDDKMIEVVMGPYYGFLLASIMCDTHIMELSINSIGTKANSKANPGSRPTHPDVIFNSENYFGSKQLPVLSASEQQSLLNEYLVNFMTAPKEYSENVPVSMNTKKAYANIDVLIDNAHVRSSFESLVRLLPVTSWIFEGNVIPIILQHTIPTPLPEMAASDGPGGQAEREAMGKTPEAVMKSYAAIRGEELVLDVTNRKNENLMLQIRLIFVGLLEDMLKHGASVWECSQHVNNAAEDVLTYIILPNLIWKVGKVEGAIRKIALAACYALLKAGSIKVEILFKHAAHLVPAVVSHLDDHYDVSLRQISCYCLTILFERLRGAFGEAAISDLYPKLLKRLDDSSDVIRIAISYTLEMFMACGANHKCYSSTMVDYTLDQCFIHLDDINPVIQECIYKVILQIATINKPLVLKKAEIAKLAHRNPNNCNKLISVLTLGYEVL